MIQAEREIVPDFFFSPNGDESQLRLHFENHSNTMCKLCEFDITALLENSNCKQFFKSLNEQL